MAAYYNSGLTIFPIQRKSKNEKTEEWGKECMDVAENIATTEDSPLRQSWYNKKANYDMFNGKLNEGDMKKVINPLGITSNVFPAKMQNYPIANTKLERLIGEEPNRRFDYIVRVVNDDAISSKEDEKKKELFSLMSGFIQSTSMSQEDLQQKLKRLSRYYNYEYQDIRELTASRLLSYFFKTMNLRGIFNNGFADALIAGEECFCVDILGGEPVVYKPNMQNVYFLRGGSSNIIDDEDIIVEIDFISPGQAIDMYYDYLEPEDIKSIEQGWSHTGEGVVRYSALTPTIRIDDFIKGQTTSDLIYLNDAGINVFGGGYDQNGNIKRVKVTWKSMRKVGKIKSTDQFDNEVVDYVPEDYKGDEKIEWIWISEWWEGTKLGNDIYLKIQPRPFQMRKMDNISVCKSGYIGNIYSFNLDNAQSLMDRVKPFQYLYNIFMYRTELAFAKSKGMLAEMNISMVPAGWDLDTWMYYMETMGMVFVNPFNELQEGAAKGKLAGTFNTVGGREINLSLGNYIQQHIAMLQYIEDQIGQISGVPRQREGHIEQRDAVKNVQQTVVQSSYITERWFMVHDNIKVRVLEALLEAAKQAWRGKSKKIQYVLDDLSTMFLNIDDDFQSSEYGVYISTALSDMQIWNDLRQAMAVQIGKDKMSVKTMIDVYLSDSVSSMRRKIEASEDEAHQRELEMIEAQAKGKQQADNDKRDMDMARMQQADTMMDKKQGYDMDKMREKDSLDKNKKLELMHEQAAIDERMGTAEKK